MSPFVTAGLVGGAALLFGIGLALVASTIYAALGPIITSAIFAFGLVCGVATLAVEIKTTRKE